MKVAVKLHLLYTCYEIQGFLHPWYKTMTRALSHPVSSTFIALLSHLLIHLSGTPLFFLFELPRILFFFSVHIRSRNYDVMT